MIADLMTRWKVLAIGAGIYAAMFVGIMIWPLQVPVGTVFGQAIFYALPAGLTAAALVLMFRTIRIINFAQVGLGIIGAQLFYELYTRGFMSYWFALGIGLLMGPLIGVLIGTIAATLFFRHPRLVMTVVSIFMVGIIGYISGQIDSGFSQEGEIRQAKPVPIPGTFENKELFIFDSVPIRVAHIVSLVLLVGLIVFLVVFFRKTRVGTAVRASAENSDRASLLGINVKALQVLVWGLVGFIGVVATFGPLPVTGTYTPGGVNGQDVSGLVLPLAAAVVARMASMPIAFFAGAGLTWVEQSLQYEISDTSWVHVGLLVLILGSLLLQKGKIQVRADEGTSWRGVKEVRPTPREMLALPAIRRTRKALMILLGIVALGIPWITGIDTANNLGMLWITSIIGLSIVVLTGWTGQISLGQMAIVAVGGFVAGNLIQRSEWPFIPALIIAGFAGAIFATVIGAPALRIRGLFLAVTTLAIAVVVDIFVFEPEYLGEQVPDKIPAPEFFFLNFQDVKSKYYLMLAFFLLTSGAVLALRRSRAGRVLIGLRDNEAGIQSFGIDVVRTRLTAFALSGFVAAFAGGLLVVHAGGMDRQIFTPFFSVALFILVVIGGVSSVVGAFLGALYFIGGSLLFPSFQEITTGVLGLIVLMAIPGGLTQVVFGIRDAVLRVVAMRQHIVVPSLFADYSPDAWEKRLAPLAPASQTHGLAALRPDQRYRLPSKVLGTAPISGETWAPVGR